MSKQKKSNIISLLAYRNKKKKRISKTSSKAASDESDFFSDTNNQPKVSKKDNQKTQIYYMSNYLKSKNISSLEEKDMSRKSREEEEQIEMGEVLDISAHRKTNTTQSNQKKSSLANMISLEDYRKTKNWPHEIEEKTAVTYIHRAVKEILPFTAMSLMMLLALNVFFPNQESNLINNKIAGNNTSQPSRGIASQDNLSKKAGQKPYFIKGTKVNKTEEKIIRRISSIFATEDVKNNWISKSHIQKIKNIKLENQTVILGKKPISTEYIGF